MRGDAASQFSREYAVPQVELSSVSKQYGNGRAILDSLTLSIAKGEFVSLVGPSGCGKSTILKLVSGLSPTTAGEIHVDGMSPENARETMSFIFQEATLLPWRTVRQNVGLGLELERVPRERRHAKVNSLLDLVGLSHVGEAYPRELSGGMKMRVSIARALATGPRLLLMDEPFAALDEISRDRLNEELLRLREEQKWTVIFVTHSVAEAVFLSTRIVVLASDPGRIHADVAVDLAYPRTAELRASPAYEQKVIEISRLLRDARSLAESGA
ncbi:NitT/TauT family transport system ATP-binding protein [Silvibacterium bohemicum]|uniref:NitT/TauT family transport system ATP-binding protein n=1 Tax=Silvibacterium bohemicum TaxID=1577686 RepID=A0A841JNR0_9BACT|nr:ABC transporter ATP-binding protein [Silvibacterium bohemicum]MBB6142075.1 NitT/TauT family transport system ATP-binding protein [Silvibacterium bohemicum]